MEMQGETEESPIIVGKFNSPLSETDQVGIKLVRTQVNSRALLIYWIPSTCAGDLRGLLMVALRSQGNWRWEGPLGTLRALDSLLPPHHLDVSLSVTVLLGIHCTQLHDGGMHPQLVPKPQIYLFSYAGF